MIGSEQKLKSQRTVASPANQKIRSWLWQRNPFMAKYRLSNTAVDDLIRIYQYGLTIFGEKQADEYYNSFFDQFDALASRPYSFDAVDYIKSGYRRCPCGVDTIYFRIVDDEVEIMTIVGMQDLKLL